MSTTVSHLGLAGGLSLTLRLQLYYLNIDGQHGAYLTLTTALSKADFPFSIATILNRPIETNISGSPNIL